jgi:hypothetical protein
MITIENGTWEFTDPHRKSFCGGEEFNMYKNNLLIKDPYHSLQD